MTTPIRILIAPQAEIGIEHLVETLQSAGYVPTIERVTNIEAALLVGTDSDSVVELRESEARYRTIAELIADYVYVVDIYADGFTDTRWISERFRQMTGFSADELYEQGGWQKMLHPEDQIHSDERKRVLLTGEVDVREFRIITKTGEVRWLRDYAKPIWHGPEDQMVHVIGAVQDITAGKEAEAALRASEKRLSAIFTNAQDAILLMNDAGCYVDSNPATCALIGYSCEELTGLYVWDLAPPEQREASKQAWQVFLEVGKQEGEIQIKTRSGRVIYAEYRAVTNVLPGLHMSILRDITERKRVELARLKEIDTLESMSTPISRITAESFGLGVLEQQQPELFEALVSAYEQLLNLALEEQTYKVSHSTSDESRELAERLAEFRAGPRDVIKLHTTVLKRKVGHESPARIQAFTEESRLVTLELMGNLLSLYRNYYFNVWRTSIAPDQEEE